jgi:hypothetical protein
MRILDSILGLFRKKQPDDDMPYSIVLLLRSPFKMTEEILAAAASRAYGVAYDGSSEKHFVMLSPILKIVKADKSTISLLESARPYFDDPEVTAKKFNHPELRKAWAQHRGWVAFDLMQSDLEKRQAYGVLAALVAELLDDRCAGIYLPKESQFTPQTDGSAATHLASLMS